jgi:hypothetical protein
MAAETGKPKQCPLCSDLPQATSHFDTEMWQAIRANAAERLEEAQCDITAAERHMAWLAEQR